MGLFSTLGDLWMSSLRSVIYFYQNKSYVFRFKYQPQTSTVAGFFDSFRKKLVKVSKKIIIYHCLDSGF